MESEEQVVGAPQGYFYLGKKTFTSSYSAQQTQCAFLLPLITISDIIA